MRADTVSAPFLSSDSHLRGVRTVRVASALFPARASPGRGCAHDPTWNVRGVVCTRNAGRGPLPFSAPGLHAFGFCAAPLHVHGAGQKGGGASPHANGGRGCLPRRLRAPSHPRGPSYSRSLPKWGRHLLCTPFARAGSEQKGGGAISQAVVHPPSCATLAWVSGTQGGGGLCRAPAFPYPVGAQTSPRLCINGGDKGGAAGVLRSVSCST